MAIFKKVRIVCPACEKVRFVTKKKSSVLGRCPICKENGKVTLSDFKEYVYCVSFRDEFNRYQIKTLGQSKKEAELYERKVKTLKAENRLNDVLEKSKKPKSILVKDFLERYIEWYESKNKDFKNRKVQIRRFTKKLRNMSLSRVTQIDIEDYILKRQMEKSPYSKKVIKKGTVDAEIVAIKHLFNKAIEWGYIDSSPAKKVKKFNEDNSRLRFLNYEEVEKLLSHCSDYLKPVVKCAVLTGMRKAEILNLKWFQVGLKKRLITLHEQKNKEIGYIYINDEFLILLTELKRHRKSEYVFTGENGKKIACFKRSFKTALKRSSIEDFRFHDLRHTFASLLVRNGEHPMVVQRLMRHKSIKMTMRYSHLSDDVLWKASNKLSEKMSRQKEKNDYNLIIISKTEEMQKS